MNSALGLAPPTPPAAWAVVTSLGEGSSGRVLRVRAADGTPAVLKLGHDARACDDLAREARALLRGGGPRTQRPLGVGWFCCVSRDGHEAAEPAAGEGALPGLLSSPREGTALTRWPEGPGASDAALDIATSLADALADLHDGGLAHGDVKPANVLVSGVDAWWIDLGMATESGTRELQRGTPRYLARGDADLGDAHARDLLAFGSLLAELIDVPLRTVDDLVSAARAAPLPSPWNEIVAALLAPRPEARPRARWIAERLSARGAPRLGRDDAVTSDRHLAAVRNAYIRLRPAALAREHEAPAGAAVWLEPLVAWGRALLAFERGPALAAEPLAPVEGPLPLAPLDERDVARWIVAVAGDRALRWPLSRLASAGEARIASAMTVLAARLPPHAWTLHDLTSALGGDERVAARAGARVEASADGREEAARIALGLASTPASDEAVRAVELDATSPVSLVLAAARALRLRGEAGRALALAKRLDVATDPGVLATAAELHRRAGDDAGARALAGRALAGARPAEAVRHGSVCLARLALDAGDIDAAIELVATEDSAPACELRAIALAQRGDVAAALDALDRASGVAADSEERARSLGTRGFVLAGSNPAAAQRAYVAAAELASMASALVEEATYLTGVAATGVDDGFLEEAANAGERAALIWQHLGHAPRAARAFLNTAAAHATAGRVPEARSHAERAAVLAAEAGDPRARAYAACVLADVATPASEAGRTAAREAVELLGADPLDALRVHARALRHELLGATDVARLDELAAAPSALPGARVEWIAERLASARRVGRGNERIEPLVSAANALVSVRAPLGSRGPMYAAALAWAQDLGLGDASLKLAGALRSASDTLLARAGPSFAPDCQALDWVRAGRAAAELGGGDLSREQMARLEQLVRSLGGEQTLHELLRAVVDALVTWTGVERGLLLLLSPDGTLVPKVARNLGQRDLAGDQLGLSMSLARRALDKLEPVVAVDAAGELPDLHASVHALRLRSVLAVPLVSRGAALGVVYLDDRVRTGAFGERELSWVRTLSTLAAAMVARATSEDLALEAKARAERRGLDLERALEDQGARLVAVESTLSDSSGRRASRAFDRVIGESDAIARTIRIAERVAAADVPVLIIGESGSGKELFARALHDSSARVKSPFVSENCSAIPETLLESALFGHVRGAFTGADRGRVGLFEAAHHGTLFLDEIGEMRPSMQTKLLRVLEDGLVRPLGTERAHKVDVRLIAATHRDLESMVGDGAFREDLFYRLSVVPLRIPPLRERRGDIALLVEHFLERYAPGKRVRISRAAMARLEAAPWPGNVRQLENEIRRALVLADDGIELEHLRVEPAAGEASLDAGLDVRKRVDQMEVTLVKEALAKTRGNQTQAAKLLGLSRFGLQKMMKRLSIAAP